MIHVIPETSYPEGYCDDAYSSTVVISVERQLFLKGFIFFKAWYF
jgi:hypothetical protein